MSAIEQALEMHEKWNGKIETTAKAHVNTREDLSLIHIFIQRLCFVFRYIKIPHTGHFYFLDLYEGILLLFFSRSASCKPSSDGFNICFYCPINMGDRACS